MNHDDFFAWKRATTKPPSVLGYLAAVRTLRAATGGVYNARSLARYADLLSKRYGPGGFRHQARVARMYLKHTGRPWHLVPKAPRDEPERYVATADDARVPDDGTPRGLLRALAVRLLWDTGCRVRELVSIPLRPSYGGKAEVGTLKNGRRRVLYWSPGTEALVARYLETRLPLGGPYLLAGLDRWGRVRRPHSRLSTRTVERWVEQLRPRCGGKIVPHSFRHGMVHRCLAAGLQPQQIRHLTGHAHAASLDHYTRYGTEEVESFARATL